MGVLKIVYCMCTKAFLCVYCFVEMSQCHWQRLLLFSFIWYLSWRRFHLSEPMINLTLLSYSLLISFLFFLYYSWSRSYIQYMQAHSVLLSLVKAPSVQHLMWGEKKKFCWASAKLTERKDSQAVWRQHKGKAEWSVRKPPSKQSVPEFLLSANPLERESL